MTQYLINEMISIACATFKQKMTFNLMKDLLSIHRYCINN